MDGIWSGKEGHKRGTGKAGKRVGIYTFKCNGTI